MNLLDRYLFRSVLATCAAAVGLFSFVMIVGNVLKRVLGYVLSGQLSLPMFAKLIGCFFQLAVPYALPMGMLAGVLLVLGRFSADNEITAIRASGVSVFRMSRPIFILGLIGAAVAMYVNGESAPRAGAAYDRELAAAVRENPLNLIVPRTFIRDFPGYVLYVGEKKGGQLRDFWLWELDGQRRVIRFLRADAGRLAYDERANELILTLADAQVESRDDKAPEDFTEAPAVASFENSDPIHLSLNRIFRQSGGSDPKRLLDKGWLTYGQLAQARAAIASQPAKPGREREKARALMKVTLTIEDKLTAACAVFSFALIGVPLGIVVSRKETSANLGVAVVVALVYYFLTVMVSWLDQHPEYRPDLLYWVPNLLLAGLGIWLFRRISRG